MINNHQAADFYVSLKTVVEDEKDKKESTEQATPLKLLVDVYLKEMLDDALFIFGNVQS